MIELSVLKETIRKFIEMLDSIGEDVSMDGLGGQAKVDMIMYCLHLMSSDGRYTEDETGLINHIFEGYEFTPSSVKFFVEEHGITSGAFNREVPGSLVAVVALDKAVREYRNDMMSLSHTMTGIYLELGKYVIASDGELDVRERDDIVGYVRMMADYVENNLDLIDPATGIS